jgi:hypothetical protein
VLRFILFVAVLVVGVLLRFSSTVQLRWQPIVSTAWVLILLAFTCAFDLDLAQYSNVLLDDYYDYAARISEHTNNATAPPTRQLPFDFKGLDAWCVSLLPCLFVSLTSHLSPSIVQCVAVAKRASSSLTRPFQMLLRSRDIKPDK